MAALHSCCTPTRMYQMHSSMAIRLLVTLATAAALRPLIIFGRPGAGKSTIAEQLVAHPDANAYNVDLDVCVPQWMRDNFAKGIYPTLAERRAFASDAAEYVVTASEGKDACCVVSFSFVNVDLRDSFRERFPDATWALVDASDALAGERISQRDGHFYDPPPARGDEWLFAPVEFEHLVLDATRPVDENVAKLLPLVRRPS